MLLRIQYTKVEGLPTFDESVAHVQKDMKLEDWAEFMVVWRRNRLEIYEEYVRSPTHTLHHLQAAHILSVDPRKGMVYWTQGSGLCHFTAICRHQDVAILPDRHVVRDHMCPATCTHVDQTARAICRTRERYQHIYLQAQKPLARGRLDLEALVRAR